MDPDSQQQLTRIRVLLLNLIIDTKNQVHNTLGEERTTLLSIMDKLNVADFHLSQASEMAEKY